jgi:hypothetical protein
MNGWPLWVVTGLSFPGDSPCLAKLKPCEGDGLLQSDWIDELTYKSESLLLEKVLQLCLPTMQWQDFEELIENPYCAVFDTSLAPRELFGAKLCSRSLYMLKLITYIGNYTTAGGRETILQPNVTTVNVLQVWAAYFIREKT